MSIQLDETFGEPPGVVAVVLAHAIEAAGWRLVDVSDDGGRLVWQVVDPRCAPATLQAMIQERDGGAHVRVTSYGGDAATRTGLEGLSSGGPADVADPTSGDDLAGRRNALGESRHDFDGDAAVLDFRRRPLE